MQIEQDVVRRCRINLEIARVNNHSEWSRDRQRDATHQRMRHVDEFDEERSQDQFVSRLDDVERSLLGKLVLFKTALHQCQRELGPVYRELDLTQQKRNATDVV